MAQIPIPPAMKKAYYPQHTDLKKFGEGLAKAYGKTEENELVECEKCKHRHWTHQSCIEENETNPATP